MNNKCAFLLGLLISLTACVKEPSVDLSGSWQVSLDSLKTFVPMQLPGTTDAAGLGIADTLAPAITEPQILRLTRKHSFLGAAFYKREIEIPRRMEGKPLELSLERVLWQSSVWIDGKRLEGAEESLATPHHYLIPDGLSGGRHEIMLRIDNRKRYDLSWRDLAHAYTNDTQVIWNGVLGQMTLRALYPVEVAHVDIYPDPVKHSAKVVARIVRHGADRKSVKLSFRADGGRTESRRFDLQGDTTQVEYICDLGDRAALWDEFSPVLHKVRVSCGKSVRAATFGLRSFIADGTDIKVNGRKVFLRGTLDCCIFPLTGNPPLDAAGWEKEFKTCREWGLNHIRFHSWCPPDAAFQVADSMGFYLQVELPDWARTIGEPAVDKFLKAEYDRIIDNYGNHPSFCMLTCGNELDRGYDFLNWMLRYMKDKDPRHIYTCTSYSMGVGHKGHPEPEDQYFVASRTHLGSIRGQNYLGSESPDFTHDYCHYTEGFTIPIVSHEIGQYSVYPDLSEIDKYTGTLDPLNFKGIKEELRRNGRLDRAGDYTKASGRFAAVLYKEEVERALKTRGMSGFQMLGLQDFSGQGTALVGLLNAFWDTKGLVRPEWFRQACAPVTPLVRYPKACWTSDETFTASVEIANYWSADITADVVWSLGSRGGTVASGTIPAVKLATGAVTELGQGISVSLSSISEARHLSLQVSLKGTQWTNSWDIWVYPSYEGTDAGEVIVARTLAEAMPSLSEGGTVLLAPDPKTISAVPSRFMPVFWSPVFFPREAGTMGILCDPGHPALALFPTEMHSDWQWWHLTNRSAAFNIGEIAGAHPIVEAVDNFTQNRQLAYIFETQCESGKLIVCSFDIMGKDNAGRPEVHQLYASLLDYMNSSAFNPSGSMEAGELKALLTGAK